MRHIEVELHAFGEEGRQLRVVELPPEDVVGDVEDVLDAVWHWGQNDIQRVPGVSEQRSLCEGDVIRHPDGHRYAIRAFGFDRLADGEPPERRDDLLRAQLQAIQRAIHQVRMKEAHRNWVPEMEQHVMEQHWMARGMEAKRQRQRRMMEGGVD